MNSIEAGADRDVEISGKSDLLEEHRMRVDQENRALTARARAPNHDHEGGHDEKDIALVRHSVRHVHKGLDESDPEPPPQSSDAGPPDALKKRYLMANKKYYFRDDEGKLAFEDRGKRIATELDDPEVAQSMVELAAAKDWQSINVKGTTEFKREVWLAASFRGMEVGGYIPSERDLARLKEMRQRRPRDRSENQIIQDLPRERAAPERLGQKQPAPDKLLREEATNRLSARQQQAVNVLKEMLKARGDSEVAIGMAAEAAADKFKNDRVYVGKLLEWGAAPFEHHPDNDGSFYVKLATSRGERTVWGVDLPRALEDGNASRGDEISLTYQGMKPVTVKVKELDAHGKPTGNVVDQTVDRNAWDISKLDTLQEIARERMVKASEITNRSEGKQPQVKVYDNTAPRREELNPAAPTVDKSKSKAQSPSR